MSEIGQKIDIPDVCPSKEEIDQQINMLAKDKFRRPIMMLAIDGAHAPTRSEPSPRNGKRGEGEWKEGERVSIVFYQWPSYYPFDKLASDPGTSRFGR